MSTPGVLVLAGPEACSDGRTLLQRLAHLDPGPVRLQAADGVVRLWANPLGVLMRHDLAGRLDVADRTVGAGELLAGWGTGPLTLPPARDNEWRVSLPPAQGYRELDTVPAPALSDLARRAGAAVRAAAAPGAAGERLLDAEGLSVQGVGGPTVSIPVRVVVVLARLGLLGGARDEVRVGASPAWIRLASRHASLYRRRLAHLQ